MDKLLADLLRPEAYPDPRPGRVELRTTHASWVLLTETEAWKLKRPVDYGFLDFSTAQKRRHFCEEELRLGARIAPGVYHGLAPLTLGPRGYGFVGPGRVVDHAVRMRRLADEDSAQSLLARGRLGPEHLSRLSARLARFYAAAALAPEAGTPDVLAANIDENHRQARPFAGRFVEANVIDRAWRWQHGVLAAKRTELLERLADERVRDGHGDLRLEHVYFPPGDGGEPLVIDAIEFNRRFRCQDAALDVAFFAMELQAAGRPDLAAFFLSSFARDSNDYGFWALIDLYLSYRAFVRAKVACFVADDPSTAPDKAARKRDEAARLFALAASFATGAQGRPRAVVAVTGMVGAGKSTLADALCRATFMPAVSSDYTRKHLAGMEATDRGVAALYTREHTARTYAELLRRAQRVLASGRGVILDATFRDPAWRAAVRSLAEREGCPFLLVELTCDEATVRRRLRHRALRPGASDADEAVLERLRASFSRAEEVPGPERLALDGGEDPEALARKVRERLEASASGDGPSL
jgi:hypothetical protein